MNIKTRYYGEPILHRNWGDETFSCYVGFYFSEVTQTSDEFDF